MVPAYEKVALSACRPENLSLIPPLGTDSEPRLGPSVVLEELDEIIASTSSFSSVNLKERVKAKYVRTHGGI